MKSYNILAIIFLVFLLSAMAIAQVTTIKEPTEPIPIKIGDVDAEIDPNVEATDKEIVDAGTEALEAKEIEILSNELQYEISKPIIAKDITRLKEAVETMKMLNNQYDK